MPTNFIKNTTSEDEKKRIIGHKTQYGHDLFEKGYQLISWGLVSIKNISSELHGSIQTLKKFIGQ
jgi:hypothetical protein